MRGVCGVASAPGRFAGCAAEAGGAVRAVLPWGGVGASGATWAVVRGLCGLRRLLSRGCGVRKRLVGYRKRIDALLAEADELGAAGAAGAAGVAGAAGAAETAGVIGTAGAAETAGVVGTAGAAEMSGEADAAGVAGAAEMAGASGVVGTVDSTGAADAAGVAGAADATGVADAADATGVVGSADSVAREWGDLIQEHLVQISFFQHERLIHPLVTLAFALMEIACVVALIIEPQTVVAALALLLLVLLVPYIVHYYFLENETQKLYRQYDLMLERRRAAK